LKARHNLKGDNMIFFIVIGIVLVLAVGLIIYRSFEDYMVSQHRGEGRPKDWRP